MAKVELSNISKRYGAVEVISGLNLTVEDGGFCALLGASGCGKSTLLRMIAGLEEVSGGTIHIGPRDVTHAVPKSRGTAMVFQSYALYPHLTVAENITFSLSLAGRPKAEQRAAAERVAGMLQLTHLLDRRPAALSGGQRQRVAIGRALVRDPEVFLFDEPLSNLDALLRVQMRLELAKLHGDLKTTMIYVTHDQVEAMTLASKIVVLDKGQIAQSGTPWELYNRPANRYVAGFIGSPGMNFLRGQGDAAGFDLPGSRLNYGKPGAVEFGIRPEHLSIAEDGPIRGRASVVEYLGNTSYAYVETDHGALVVEADGQDVKPGDLLGLVPDLTRAHLFDAKGERV
jgi:ABC-type sugar transport system ATPase subunit